MRRLKIAFALVAIWLCTVTSIGKAAEPASVSAAEWSAFTERFLDPDGRIIDNANGNISHSEGQGYGLLLSYLADNRGDFDRIWAFTRTQLLVRDDGLAAWKWDPATVPHVSDPNNATDGDLLIAYALALAGKSWKRPDLLQFATGMAQALGKTGIEDVEGMKLMKPGAAGFGRADRADGPVVNPSYWVFEAFPLMNELAPEAGWRRVSESGLALAKSATAIGNAGLPPDWVSLRTAPRAANGFPQEFGYNAFRVPLYMMRAGIRDRTLLEPFLTHMADEDGNVRIVDIASGQTKSVLDDPGYRIIPALVACVLEGKQLPQDMQTFKPQFYYPATLQLLALSYARSTQQGCL